MNTTVRAKEIVINPEVIIKNGMFVPDYLYLFSFLNGLTFRNMTDVRNRLARNGYFDKNGITLKGRQMVQKIVAESANVKLNEDEFETMASEMIAAYPQGYKIVDDKKYNWVEHPVSVVAKLKNLSVRMHVSLNVDDVISATYAYVDSFNEDFTYMRTLSNFIMKEEDGIAKSELLEMIHKLKTHDEELLNPSPTTTKNNEDYDPTKDPNSNQYRFRQRKAPGQTKGTLINL